MFIEKFRTQSDICSHHFGKCIELLIADGSEVFLKSMPSKVFRMHLSKLIKFRKIGNLFPITEDA